MSMKPARGGLGAKDMDSRYRTFIAGALAVLGGLALPGCNKPTMGYGEAIETGNVEQVRRNLAWPESKFVRIDAPLDKTGRQPLHRAAELGHLDLVSFLIERGADVNSRGYWHNNATPLHLAEKAGHDEVANFLRKQGAKAVAPRR